MLDLAARSNTAIYAIGLGVRTVSGTASSGRLAAEDAPFVLRQLAQLTGGRAFFPLEARDLTAVYGEIREELSSQYSLAYESTNARRNGQYRHIAVRIHRVGVVARTRPGYYAPTK